MAELVLDAVTKVYNPRGRHPVVAVDRADMQIEHGEIIALLGSSGCGKTSTLRMIAGFESISSGDIRIGDRRINDLAPAKRNVAMAFEGYSLYPPLRVRDNIGFALLRDRRPRSEVARRVNEIAELLEITDILDRYPPNISAGQQQRTSLARALIRDADVFLLDEPMSQLEPRLRAVLRARIKDWIISHQMTTVFVTHDQTEAIALADRIAVMENGVMQQFAPPSSLKEQPANLFVASFIGEPPMNIFEAEVLRQDEKTLLLAMDRGGEAFRIELPDLQEEATVHSPLHHGQKLHLGIRPHRVRLGSGQIRGRVTSHHWLGDQSHIGIELGQSLLIAVAHGVVDAPSGSDIMLDMPPESIHIFDYENDRALRHGLHPAGLSVASEQAA